MTVYVRNPEAVLYSSAGVCAVVVPGSIDSARFTSEEAILVRAIVAAAAHGLPRGALAEVGGDGDGDDERARVAGSLVDRLISSGMLVEKAADPVSILDVSGPPMLGSIVAGICGSVAAVTAPALLYRIARTLTTTLDVVLTRSAQEFLHPYGVESLTGARVWTDLYQRQDGIRSPHIYLANEADLVLISPTSASMIAKLAQARCDDLLSLVATATDAPVVIVPVMNQGLWSSVAVQENVEAVRALGMFVVEPSLGLEVGIPLRDQQPQLGGQGVFERNVVPLIDSVIQHVRDQRRLENGS